MVFFDRWKPAPKIAACSPKVPPALPPGARSIKAAAGSHQSRRHQNRASPPTCSSREFEIFKPRPFRIAPDGGKNIPRRKDPLVAEEPTPPSSAPACEPTGEPQPARRMIKPAPKGPDLGPGFHGSENHFNCTRRRGHVRVQKPQHIATGIDRRRRAGIHLCAAPSSRLKYLNPVPVRHGNRLIGTAAIHHPNWHRRTRLQPPREQVLQSRIVVQYRNDDREFRWRTHDHETISPGGYSEVNAALARHKEPDSE